jgi:MoaA/NifB/PqqE/SkfB family radical SAM enzyme
MRAAGVQEIGLFYIGESTMSPELLLSCLRWVKGIGFPYAFLTTNGSLLDRGLARELMAAGLDSLKFSINASGPGQFKEVMGVKPRLFEAALQNLKAAREERDAGGYSTRIYASSIKFSGEQQAQMEALLAERVVPYVDQHYWLPLFSEMQSPLAEKNKARGWKPNAGNQGRLDNLRDPLPCWAVFTEGHVRVDGHLSACCFGATDAFDMGDLTQTPFMEAWNSKAFMDLRTKHLFGDVHGSVCESCIHGAA